VLAQRVCPLLGYNLSHSLINTGWLKCADRTAGSTIPKRHSGRNLQRHRQSHQHFVLSHLSRVPLGGQCQALMTGAD
jgi:hypothetical protein